MDKLGHRSCKVNREALLASMKEYRKCYGGLFAIRGPVEGKYMAPELVGPTCEVCKKPLRISDLKEALDDDFEAGADLLRIEQVCETLYKDRVIDIRAYDRLKLSIAGVKEPSIAVPAHSISTYVPRTVPPAIPAATIKCVYCSKPAIPPDICVFECNHVYHTACLKGLVVKGARSLGANGTIPCVAVGCKVVCPVQKLLKDGVVTQKELMPVQAEKKICSKCGLEIRMGKKDDDEISFKECEHVFHCTCISVARTKCPLCAAAAKGKPERCAGCDLVETVSEKLVALECGHRYHKGCVLELVNKYKGQCMVCNKRVDQRTLQKIGVAAPYHAPLHGSVVVTAAAPTAKFQHHHASGL